MSITAATSSTFTATVDNAATGLTGTIAVRIEDTHNAVVFGPTTAGIIESGTGLYTVTLTAPATAGTYLVIWNDGTPGDAEASDQLNVTQAPIGRDLTTLAAVRAEQQKPSSNVDQDAIIATLITQASDEIMRWTEREFAPVTTGQARVFELGRGDEGWLSLAPYDLASLTSVMLDTDTATPVTLTAAEYRAYPRNSPDHLIRAIRLAPYRLVAPSIRFAMREVTVTGNWGFPSIPAAVERACIITVNQWLQERYLRDPGMMAEMAEVGAAVGRMVALPTAARAMLEHYRVYGA